MTSSGLGSAKPLAGDRHLFDISSRMLRISLPYARWLSRGGENVLTPLPFRFIFRRLARSIGGSVMRRLALIALIAAIASPAPAKRDPRPPSPDQRVAIEQALRQ